MQHLPCRQAIVLAVCAALCVPAHGHEKVATEPDSIVVEGHRHNGVGNSDSASEGTATRRWTG